MAAVRVTVDLPYDLNLPRGEYPAGEKERVTLAKVVVLSPTHEPRPIRTRISCIFDAPDEIDRDSAMRLAARKADKVIRHANRLLRWYRQLSSLPGILEVTRAQVSPIKFTVVNSERSQIAPVQSWVLPVLEFEAEQPVSAQFATIDDLAAALRENLETANEPDVAHLNLLDAQHAKSVGRFREAVLLSWSVIDSSFVGKFEALVDEKLAKEWGEARDFLKGHDFGLRHRMTSGLRLIAGRSFFDEPNGFWNQLSTSYGKRNAIIHGGFGADEDDAEQAITVARKVLDIIDTL